jgi:hypothetical protein
MAWPALNGSRTTKQPSSEEIMECYDAAPRVKDKAASSIEGV